MHLLTETLAMPALGAIGFAMFLSGALVASAGAHTARAGRIENVSGLLIIGGLMLLGASLQMSIWPF
jgi:hypothetical protein